MKYKLSVRFVKFFKRNDLTTKPIDNIPGWFSQQYLKLQVSNYISTDYYLIYDTKNVFIDYVWISNFFHSNTLKHFDCVKKSNLAREHQEFYDLSSTSLDYKSNSEDLFPHSITPFMMDTAIAQSLLKHSPLILEKILDNKAMEFTSYYLHEKYIYKRRSI